MVSALSQHQKSSDATWLSRPRLLRDASTLECGTRIRVLEITDQASQDVRTCTMVVGGCPETPAGWTARCKAPLGGRRDLEVSALSRLVEMEKGSSTAMAV